MERIILTAIPRGEPQFIMLRAAQMNPITLIREFPCNMKYDIDIVPPTNPTSKIATKVVVLTYENIYKHD